MEHTLITVERFIFLFLLNQVHPCDKEDKAGCEQVCEKKGTEAVCKCTEGFELEADGKFCKEGESTQKYIIHLVS